MSRERECYQIQACGKYALDIWVGCPRYGFPNCLSHQSCVLLYGLSQFRSCLQDDLGLHLWEVEGTVDREVQDFPPGILPTSFLGDRTVKVGWGSWEQHGASDVELCKPSLQL